MAGWHYLLQLIKRHRWGLLLLLPAAFICLYTPVQQEVNYDEEASFNIATGAGVMRTFAMSGLLPVPLPHPVFTSADYRERNTVANVVRYTSADDGHGLGYYVVLHGWMKLAGVSVRKARLLSGLLMLVAIGLSYVAAYRLFGNRSIAAISMLLLMLHPTVAEQAHFARMYPLAMVLTFLELLLVLRLCRDNAKWNVAAAVLLALLCGVSVTTHYLTAFPVAAGYLYWLWRRRQMKRQLWLPILAGILSAAVVLWWQLVARAYVSFQLIGALHQYAATHPMANFTPTTPVTFGENILAVTSGLVGCSAMPGFVWQSVVSQLAGLCGLVLVVWQVKRLWQGHKDAVRYALLAVGLYYAGSSFIATYTGYTTVFYVRYWLFCLPFSLPLAAGSFWMAWQDSRQWVRLTAALCLGVVLVRMGGGYYRYATTRTEPAPGSDAYYVNGDKREDVARRLTASCKAGDTVVYQNWTLAQETNWFLQGRGDVVQVVDSALGKPIVVRKQR